ncbi:MAG: DEAD/DEAH box helicase [Alphaproteobacteria bacterium]|nr:DEAD/DEAH box helicase [Alphaproteobacteria bacterium]
MTAPDRSPLVRFDQGTLVLEDFDAPDIPDGFVFDERIRRWRGPGYRYHDVVMGLHRSKQPYRDEARAYEALDRPHRTARTPRDYQQEAVEAWWRSGRRGVVVLPTGAGKSFVAELCIARANRAALVVAPTIDLVGQWYDGLKRAFGEPVGILGGGVHEVQPITVSTYDSAYLYMDRYGARFGLVVFDEVHHLPGPALSTAAEMLIAPFRLGLTATLERPDGAHGDLDALVGPQVYRREITELSGEFLADYTTELVSVELSEAERIAYDEARAEYRMFVEVNNIRMGGGGWQRFLREAARSSEGRRAFHAWRESRRILHETPAKLEVLAELLRRHAGQRVLVFTNDNATVYRISRALLLPTITHQTDVKERRALLDAFADGTLPVLLTSRVLNEGVDLPSAEVAVVLSGTGTVREHVQRLGRILRKVDGKSAVLYEVVVTGTTEEHTSQRRRDHVAYR